MFYWLKDKLSKSGVVKAVFSVLPDWLLRVRPLRQVIIEPTNICNLSCPFCTNRISQKPKGVMTKERFERLMDLLPKTIKKVTLHFSGESFINPDTPEMVKILKERGIKVQISTNGTMDFAVYRHAIESGLDLMLVAIDGPNKELHERYRINSNFEKITETVKKLCSLPDRKTKIMIQYLVMRHNEELIPQMKRLAEDLGADELWLKTTSFNIASNQKMEEDVLKSAREFLPQNPKYCRYRIEGGRLVNTDKPKLCNWFWQTVILWNGDLAICCADLENEVKVGNVFEEGFAKLWKSKRYAQVRNGMIRQSLPPCRNCNVANKPYVEKIRFLPKNL